MAAISVEEVNYFKDHIPPRKYLRTLGWRTGVIRQLYRLDVETGDPRLFHVSLLHSNLERFGVPGGTDLRAAGSGMGMADALCRAVGELVERICCCFHEEEQLVFESYDSLQKQGLDALGPDRLAFFNESQLGEKAFPFKRYDENSRLVWIKGRSLLTGAPIYVPSQFIHLAHKLRPEESHVTYMCSSGLACATSYAEALLKGIYEQLERDAVMIHWYARLSSPLLRFEDLRNHRLAHLYARNYNAPGARYLLKHVTLDVPVPVFLGLQRICVAGRPRLSVGGSANLDPREAAFKAMLELGQGVPFIKVIIIQDPFLTGEKMRFDNLNDNLRYYADPANIHHLDFLTGEKEVVELSSLPNLATGQVERDLKTTLRLLADRGLTPVAIDFSSPEFLDLGFHVTRVLIPELVQMGVPRYPFHGARRLYELPARLGLRDGVLQNEDLNPVPHPYP